MMNPFIINKRDIFPSQSLPAIIQDHKLIFCWGSGMGCAVPVQGETFHGVIHRCTEEEMINLDRIEGGMKRRKARAKLYDGTEVECTVYS